MRYWSVHSGDMCYVRVPKTRLIVHLGLVRFTTANENLQNVIDDPDLLR